MKTIIFSLLFFLFIPIAFSQTGTASWFSSEACRFNPDPKCPTASGRSLYELEEKGENFAASYEYPLGTLLRITNTKTHRWTEARVLDRGPNKRLNRVIDLCRKAFSEIADPKKGLIQVEVEVL